MNCYYDLDLIIAQEEKIRVLFEREVEWCGYLVGPDQDEEACASIPAGTTAFIPIWLAKGLKEGRSTARIVTVLPSRTFQHELLHILRADPESVNFYEKSRYFLYVCCWMCKFLDADASGHRLFLALMSAFVCRTRSIFYLASQGGPKNGRCYERLELLERQIYKGTPRALQA